MKPHNRLALIAVLVGASAIGGVAAGQNGGGAAFQSIALPGSTLAGVVPGPGGLFYGVTYDGGANGHGTIFAASFDTGTATLLHSFDGNDGRVPYTELTADGSLLYGTTDSGGASGGGTVFAFNPATGSLQTLAAFGAFGGPSALLRIGEFLYGSTSNFPGGSSVFRVRRDGTEPVEFLHVFSTTDGQAPGTLTPGSDGYLYGTAAVGGLAGCEAAPYNGCGTIFRLRPDGTGFEVVYRFDSNTIAGRGFPERKLVVSSDGRLYGTTFKGVFSLAPNPAAPDFQVLYTVPPGFGTQIFAPPIEGSDGRLYINQYDGSNGPSSGVGSVYSMTKSGADVLTHHLFTLTGGGQGPYGVMFLDSAGTIYGTTEYSDAPTADGTVFALGVGAQGGTTTTLVSSENPSSPGEAVTFTATVTPAGATGSITFKDGGTALGAPVSLVAGSASLTTPALTLGTHVITAEYSGGGASQPSTGQLTQTVAVPTTTALASTPNPSIAGQTVTFTATVSSSTPATGTVVFRDAGVQIGLPALIANGVATLSTSALTVGTHQIAAEYGGDGSHRASTSPPVSQIVNFASAGVGLLSSKNPSKIGDAVTLTATLAADAMGTVTFLDNGIELASRSVSFGEASFTTTGLSIGVHPIVARYSGDAKYLAADSATLNQTVNPLNSAPQIFPIGDRTIRWGDALVIGIGVTDLDGDPITLSLLAPPAGASLSGTLFSWTPSGAQVGTTTITVQASDGQLSSPATFAVTVLRQPSGVIYEQPPLAAAPGLTEFRATLRDGAQAPLPGRTIVFQVGTQTASGVTDAMGRAVGSVMLSQPSGTISVTASFAGDAVYLPSADARPFTISRPPVVAVVTPQQVLWGRTLTFSFQASDPDGDPFTVTVLNQPPGMQRDFTFNTLTWTPTIGQVGTTTIVLRATDGVSTTLTPVVITVLPHATAAIDLAPAAAGSGPVVLRATLVDLEFDQPVAGRSLSFVVGTQTTTGITDPLGVGRAPLTINQPLGPTTIAASYAGEPAYLPSSTQRSFSVSQDTDGDALPDDWEINGVDVDGNGTIDFDLPGMGANPLRKDLFVEADWMLKPPTCLGLVCYGERLLKPQPAALQIVIDAFLAAPVPNPDGSTGISLHVDAGPDSIMDPLTGETWGTRSRGGLVPYQSPLGTIVNGVYYIFDDFDLVKQASFDQTRRGIFRYALYADRLAWAFPAGLARDVGATDFIVVAGHPAWNGGITVLQEADVFMHELGHTVSLGHGGGDGINYKPNYFSIMNYLFGYVGVPPDGRMDFSRVAEPPIDETVVGDVNGDFFADLLLGFDDWTNLNYTGGGIGDLLAFPAPRLVPMVDPNDPEEFRRRGTFARDGDGVAVFEGPSLLVRNSGQRRLIVDVDNPSGADSTYEVSLQSALVTSPLSAGIAVSANGSGRVTFPIDTTGLAAGDYEIVLTLRGLGGRVLHQSRHRITVIDLADAATAEAARQTAALLAQLPAGSELDPAVIADVLDMIDDAASDWRAVVVVSGRRSFSASYEIGEPDLPGLIGLIRARSAAGDPLFELDLIRVAVVAAGRVRMRDPSGAVFDAAVAGRWNATTRTFTGTWVASRTSSGSITIQLQRR